MTVMPAVNASRDILPLPAFEKKLFEIWIRPVAPENAHMALRIALHELDRLIEQGLTAEAFASTREYLRTSRS